MERVRVTKRDSSQKRRKTPEITDVAGQIEEHWTTKTGFSLLLMPPPWRRRGNQSYSKPGPPYTKAKAHEKVPGPTNAESGWGRQCGQDNFLRSSQYHFVRLYISWGSTQGPSWWGQGASYLKLSCSGILKARTVITQRLWGTCYSLWVGDSPTSWLREGKEWDLDTLRDSGCGKEQITSAETEGLDACSSWLLYLELPLCHMVFRAEDSEAQLKQNTLPPCSSPGHSRLDTGKNAKAQWWGPFPPCL